MLIKLQKATNEDISLVQKIFESSPTYFRNTDKSEVKPHFAEREMNSMPPKERQTEGYQKLFCLVYVNDEAIGVIDLHKDHPQMGTTYIGLLLIKETLHGKGLGRLIYETAEEYCKKELGAERIALGISQENDVEKFWEKVGFKRNGNQYTWVSEGHENQVFELSKSLL